MKLPGVRRLVRLMGGDVKATSTPGQGSCMSFTVVLARTGDLPSSGAGGAGTAAVSTRALPMQGMDLR